MHYFKYRKFVTVFSIVRNMATVKRFYRKTNILSSGGKYEITLDQRKLKTPQGKVFQVDSMPLALAVAAEWDMQKEIVDRSNMHLTALCNTVIDNPHNYTKENMVNYIVNCLEMDTVLFHSSENDELYKLQTTNWDPLVQWFCDNYTVNIMKTQSIQAPTVPPETKTVLIRHLMSYNYNAVHGFMYGVDAVKSVILTLAAAERVISIKEAVRQSRLEEDYQVSHWGSVEWFHDHNNFKYGKRMFQQRMILLLRHDLNTPPHSYTNDGCIHSGDIHQPHDLLQDWNWLSDKLRFQCVIQCQIYNQKIQYEEVNHGVKIQSFSTYVHLNSNIDIFNIEIIHFS